MQRSTLYLVEYLFILKGKISEQLGEKTILTRVPEKVSRMMSLRVKEFICQLDLKKKKKPFSGREHCSQYATCL